MLGIEQCSRAGWTRAQWFGEHRETVRHAAQWAAWYLAERLNVAVNQETLKKLVVGPDRDHIFGGCSDHWDPGPNYPWDVFRKDAIDYATQVGCRVIVTVGDQRRVKNFRASKLKRGLAFAKKRVKRGKRVVLKKVVRRGDFED